MREEVDAQAEYKRQDKIGLTSDLEFVKRVVAAQRIKDGKKRRGGK